MKEINLIINSCDECPYLTEECEYPGFYCKHSNFDGMCRELCTKRKTLKILGIPDNCPLKDVIE